MDTSTRKPRKYNVSPGDVFNRWTVIQEVERRNGKRRFLCIGETGLKREVYLAHLVSGESKGISTRGEAASNYKHGKSHTRPTNIWLGMKSRCNDSNSVQYKDYGGRGITYDPAWETFESFWKDMEEGYSPNLSIDRINNDGNYEKGNCRWASTREQNRNTRRTLTVEFKGETRKLVELAEEAGINYHTLYNRIRRGVAIELAIVPPAGILTVKDHG